MKNSGKNSGFETYRRLTGVAKPYWLLFVFGVIGTIILSATDAGFAWLVQPIINTAFAKNAHGHAHDFLYHWIPFFIVMIFMIRGITSFTSTYAITRVARTVVRDLRRLIFSKLLQLPASFYDRHNSGRLLSIIVYNVEQVAQASSDALLICLRESSLAIGLIVVMFVASWTLSLLFLVITPLMAWVVKWMSVRMRRLSGHVQQSMGDVTQVASETIDGYRVVRLYGGQQYERNKFDTVTKTNLQRELKVVVTNSTGTAIIQMLIAIPIAMMFFIAIKSGISAGAFASMVTAMIMLLRPMRRMSAVNTEIQKGVAAADSIFALTDEPIEKESGTKTLSCANGDIVFRDVSFHYHSAEKPILSHLSFSVKAGETIAIVGKSGSGKSTLVNLIPRFYEPTAGDITLDGVNVRDYCLADLRKQFAFVSQDTVLFDDTVFNNIAYGLENVDQQSVIKAATAAHAIEFIEQLPNGFDTKIGEAGVLLSGGQRQRIAIARALLKNAPLLILDEATASLDAHAEKHIQAALDELMQSRTVLVIAHRLSTVEKADRIIVLENGVIVEIGTHAALLENAGAYAGLYRAQLQKPSVELRA
ncbi:MAG TPA: lipid A export permease/ATP-binding protein MsbA [Coxiellaceae bacterium]|nr:lipid A export permease/ATP-binding protein MsbA [Coxiellaceae bacterium]